VHRKTGYHGFIFAPRIGQTTPGLQISNLNEAKTLADIHNIPVRRR
jgi:hypothetical protein